MIEKIEFYNTPDGSVCCKPEGKPMFILDESCRPLIEEMIVTIKELYPDAFKALSELYSTSERNRSFYEYRIVHRFIRCNFGEYDALHADVDAMGGLHIEEVKCPMRGECRLEGCVCRPRLQSTLSPREREVALLLGKGYDKLEVANELMRCSGKIVELHYKEYLGALPWRGMQKHVVDKIISVTSTE